MLLKNIIINEKSRDILIENGKIADIGKISGRGIDCFGFTALPAFCDLHVHLREPGQEHKETIFSGSLAARNGGYSDIFCMPNTKPVCDCVEVIKLIQKRQSMVKVHPVAAVSKGQKGTALCDFGAYREAGILAVSDDGMPVSDDELLLRAMYSSKKNGLLLLCHCENKDFAKDRLNTPSEAEFTDVDRVLRLARQADTRLHLCHISTKESVELIRKAKKEGVDVTAETCPHYFALTKEAFKSFGQNAMMNPPLRDKADNEAIIEALCDGTLDMISTDHAPHSAEEKAVDPAEAPFGIIGLETAFSVSFTNLVKTGFMPLSRLVYLMSSSPFNRIKIPENKLEKGAAANFIVADLESSFSYDVKTSLSKSRNTPFNGSFLTGKIIYNIHEGELFTCQ